MHILFYISGHGFGHAARTTQVINTLVRRDPSIQVTVRTTVPTWFLRDSLERPVDVVFGETDPGVVQPDSLSIDERDTAQRAASFYGNFQGRVEHERAFIRARRPALVVGDIPPLAFASAAAAGVPSLAVGNFTWDWIYTGFPDFDRAAPGVRATISDADARASYALRLPFSGGFASMPVVQDIPLIARRAVLEKHDTRARLSLPSDRPVVLASFGGHGGNVPLSHAADNGSFLLVATDYVAGTTTPAHPNLRVVRSDELQQTGVSYTDLVAATDVVVTKIGYGIVSECVANDVALLYTLRGRFIEQDVFIREMPEVMRSRHIDRKELQAGQWAGSVEALLAQAAPGRTLPTGGAEIVAATIIEMASS